MQRILTLILISWFCQGSMSLKNWDVDNVKYLDGDWMFFYGEHLEPTEFLRRAQNPQFKPHYTQVGKSFKESALGKANQEHGIATYVMRFQDVPASFREPVGIFANNIYTASRLYFFAADGQGSEHVIQKLGEPGKDKLTSLPQFSASKPVILNWYGSQDHFLLIQVSNFHYHRSGIRTAPELDSYRRLETTVRFHDDINFIVLGVIMLATMYNLFIYLNRREDTGSLLLSVFGIVMMLRLFALSTVADNPLGDLIMSYEFFWKVIFATMIVPGVIYLGFQQHVFPQQTPKGLLKFFSLLALIYFLFVLIMPVRSFAMIATLGKTSSAILAVISLFILYRAVLAGERGARIAMLGSLFLLLSGGLDLIELFGISKVPMNSGNYGWAVFLVMQGQIAAIRFAHAFDSVEKMTVQLQLEVDRKVREVQAILQSIEQGIVMLVSSDGRMGPQYSADAKTILGVDGIQGRSIQDLILDHSKLDTEQKSMLLSALEASIGEDRVGFDFNQECLLREIVWKDPRSGAEKILELDWEPICDKNQVVEKVMLCFRDVTNLRDLQKEAQQHQEDLRIFREILELPEERFQRFVCKAHEYLRENRELVEQYPNNSKRSEILRALFINMHTLKGTARAFLMKSISTACHDVEQYYASLQTNTEGWDSDRLLGDINRVSDLVRTYERVGRNKLGWNTSEKVTSVHQSTLVSLLKELRRVEPQLQSPDAHHLAQELSSQLLDHCYDRLTDVLAESTKGFESIARNLKKALPRFVIGSSSVRLREEGSDLVAVVMTHLLRNSLDHGLEYPDERVSVGKPPEGCVTLDIQEKSDGVILKVSDDGRGLNLNRILTLARTQGLVSEHENPGPQEVAELIFHPGFSTKDVVSDISGRGVGMDAVKTYVEQAGGAIRVMFTTSAPDPEHAYFEFEIRLPGSLLAA
jgi:signal transduction histidine kinase